MRRIVFPCVVLISLSAATGCSGGGKSAVPKPSASPTAEARQLLAERAKIGSAASFSADYTVSGQNTGTARIVRTPTSYRFELTTGSGAQVRHAVLIQTDTGTVSCTLLPKPITCLTVAAAGKAVPSVFDAGLQHVFTDYLEALANAPASYGVTPAPADAHDGACFDVTNTASPAPTDAVATGTYCLGSDGVPTRVSYPSGELVLTTVGPAPAPADFVPPVTPKRLP